MSPTAQAERPETSPERPSPRMHRHPHRSAVISGDRRNPWRRRSWSCSWSCSRQWPGRTSTRDIGRSAGWEMRTINGSATTARAGPSTPSRSGLHTAPSADLRASDRSLPPRPTTQQAALVSRQRALELLPRVDPVIRPSLPGEAAWRPGRLGPSGHPAIYTTWFRPDRHHPTLVAGTSGLIRLRRVPSRRRHQRPWWRPVARPRTGRTGRSTATLAAFNAGFLMSGCDGGFAEQASSRSRSPTTKHRW